MEDVVTLDFGDQQSAAQKNDGWMQARYYSEDGESVKEFLSFNKTHDINKFVILTKEEKAAIKVEKAKYKVLYPEVIARLELKDKLAQAFIALSNGEMRRALIARAILMAPKKLVLNHPTAGVDPVWRQKFQAVFAWVKKQGIGLEIIELNKEESSRLTSKVSRQFDNLQLTRDDRRETRAAVVELKDICISFGKRKLFDHFNWTVRQGERWIIRGPNGSGKTTLMALITGDSPLGYANDVKVFGQQRGSGSILAEVRDRIGIVSTEMQTYLGLSPEECLARACERPIDLLILDEPCLNLPPERAAALCRKISTFLRKNQELTAICIVHRDDHIPKGFTNLLDLSAKI